MKKNINLIISLSFIILLSSCKKQGIVKQQANWSNVSSWSIYGKMAIKSDQQSGSGRINWHQDQHKTYAQFKAPLGQGSWEITEQVDQAFVVSSKTGKKYGRDAEQLIAQELGWYFPWKQLSLWLRGVKTPAQLNTQHKAIDQITDQGWHISFDKWQQTSLGMLPKKITATKTPYSVKVIIYDWQIN